MPFSEADRGKKLFEPFDVTYEAVTDNFNEVLGGDMRYPALAAWLDRIVRRFKAEREQWGKYPPLSQMDAYLAECTRLRPKILRLTAGAYLHISYDLPRVLADSFAIPVDVTPGVGPRDWRPEYEDLYFSLAPRFRDIFAKVGKSYSAVGVYSLLLRVVPPDVAGALSLWAVRLRGDAWRHAIRLATYPPGARPAAHDRMLRAMSTAIQHVNNWKPWSIVVLEPPDSALPASNSAPVGWATVVGLGAGIVASVAIGIAVFAWRTNREIALYLRELASRIQEYVDVALDPERSFDFERFLASRAPEMKR